MENKIFQKMLKLESSHWWFVARRKIIQKAISYIKVLKSNNKFSFVELKPGEAFYLNEQPKVNEKFKKVFYKNPLVKSIRLTKELNKTKYSKIGEKLI